MREFYVSQNEDGYFYDMDFVDNDINEDVFKLQYFKGKGDETFLKCQDLLDKGEPVIIYTDTRKVPFFNDNQGEGTEPTNAGVELGHVFLLIHREDELLYYVEAPLEYNKYIITGHSPRIQNNRIKDSEYFHLILNP